MNRFQANICLIVVTLLWSCEVVIFSVIPPEVPAWATMCITSTIGAFLLWACFAKRIMRSFRQGGMGLVRLAAEGAAPTISDDNGTVGDVLKGPRSSEDADTVTAGLARIPTPAMRKAVLFAVLVAVYLVVAVPFKVLVVIPGFTDVRPVSMLQPIYGIFFGIPGCLAAAVGNLLFDIISGDLRWSSIAGFAGTFLYSYLMYVFWARVRRGDFNLRSGRMLALFCATVLVCSLVQTLVIAPAVEFHYPTVDSLFFALVVFVNGAAFPIVFAPPFVALIQDELGFAPCSRRMKSDA